VAMVGFAKAQLGADAEAVVHPELGWPQAEIPKAGV
jgi:hypothetical protein